MDILELIKKRASVRKYKKKKIPKKVLSKIIEAGIWGPSVHGIQTTKFVVLTNSDKKKAFVKELKKQVSNEYIGYKILLRSTITTIDSCSVCIFVFNERLIHKKLNRMGKKYERLATLTEIQSAAAGIQNMVLVADSFDISSCWLSLPTMYIKAINKIINCEGDFIAVLTLGYSNQKGVRAKRKIKVNWIC